MTIDNLPFGATGWTTVAPSVHAAISGQALWRTRQFDLD
jgi:hypothetical protein